MVYFVGFTILFLLTKKFSQKIIILAAIIFSILLFFIFVQTERISGNLNGGIGAGYLEYFLYSSSKDLPSNETYISSYFISIILFFMFMIIKKLLNLKFFVIS